MFKTDMLDIRPKADPRAVVQGEKYRFTVLTSRMIRMEWSEDGKFLDEPTRMVLCREFPVPEFTVEETADRLEIITEHLHLYYDKQEFTEGGLSIAIKGMIKHKCAKWHYKMKPIYILYENDTRGGCNRGGTARTLDMVDGECDLGTGLIDRHGFVTLDDADTMVLDKDGWYAPAENKNRVDLYFLGYLEEHTDLLRDYYKLSGATPMLPRYALGNWWSRYYPYTEQTYTELMEKFAEKQVPLAVSVVDMDWHITKPDPKYGNGWTGYTWNRELFPDPKRFMKWLHDHDLRLTMNIHPCDGIRAFEDCYKETAEAMGIDPATEKPVQFDVSDPKFMRVYLDKVLHPLEDDGVDFWWIDWQQYDGFEKDGYDPLWALNHYLYTDNARKGTYPLTMSRYAGLGSHRYPVGFSGDTIISWATLDFQPNFTNTAANVGYGWWSHDIGGHKIGIWSDDMQVRWAQYGVFSPIYRPHSANHPFFLKEPWNFPVQYELILEDYMRLRHALIPYLYTMNYRNHTDGIPLCTPLCYTYHKLTNNASFNNEYFFGSELIVCPITSPLDQRGGTGSVKAWIPEGDWFDFFTGRRYHGHKIMNLYRQQADYPVLAKAGGIVPLADDGFVNGAPLPKKLRIRAFAGADGAFELYEDNEQLKNTKKAVTPFTVRWGNTAVFTKEAVRGDKGVAPDHRTYALEFVGAEKPASVTVKVAGKTVNADWRYCKKCATLFVTAEADGDQTLTVELGTNTLAENDYRTEISERLPRYQIENVTKAQIYKTLTAAASRAEILSQLPALCGPEDGYILGELTEILSAAL